MYSNTESRRKLIVANDTDESRLERRNSYFTDVAAEPDIAREISRTLLEYNDDILIIGHLRPDGDCLGSCLALYEVLRTLGKSVRFYTFGPIPAFFDYLPSFDKILTTYPENASLVVSVDTSSPDRISDVFQPPANLINIDHHITNTMFGRLNWVDSNATAAAEMIYRLMAIMGVKLTAPVASALYTGLLTDTGGFRYSNTTGTTFGISSHLVQSGASPSKIAQAIFDSRTPEAIKLTGLIFSSLNYEFDGRLVWNRITRQLLQQVGGNESEPEGLSSELRSVSGVEVSVLFYESAEGFCRCGFRSKGEINVAELAGLMGGGGHHNASGATIREPYEIATATALSIIRSYLAERWGK
jgi:phosphoesterase RecJ-like protein